MARSITLRELRNSSEIVQALSRGERFVVTHDGLPVGELTPLRRRRFVPVSEFLASFSGSAPVDATRFREEVDRFVDQDPIPRD